MRMRVTVACPSPCLRRPFLTSCILLLMLLFTYVATLLRTRPRWYPVIRREGLSWFLAPVNTARHESAALPLCPLVVDVDTAAAEPFNASAPGLPYDSSGISPGGGWSPSHCLSHHTVAIIVPYRNREDHLTVFLSRMHGFLQAQLLDYRIYVVEQTPPLPFNRGLLLNIGFVEVSKRDRIPCFIFHDVDLLPESLENTYACTIEPRHMSSSINTFNYGMPYENFFGGVVSFLQFQFQAVNGFSNRYFGWGGEDDDLFLRTENRGLNIFRFSPSISGYFMMPHKKDTLVPENALLLGEALFNQDYDGLNSIQTAYRLLKVDSKPLYTHIHVDPLQSDK